MTSLQLAKYTGGSSSSSYNIYTHIHSRTNIIIALPLAQPHNQHNCTNLILWRRHR